VVRKRSAFGWQAKAPAPHLKIISFVALLAAPTIYAAKLTPQTAAAFDRYILLTEARMKTDWKAKVRGGNIRIEAGLTLDNGKKIDVPDGMIQHWVGSMFIPGASIAQVKAVLQDYENYKNFYRPEVIESKQISHQGDEYDVFLRLYKKHVLTVVLNSNYHVRYDTPDPHHMYVISHSTRIAQVKDAGHPDAGEEQVGDDNGFLWQLNAYWRFEQADGGVYAECEAVSLSRDLPPLIGWMIRGFVEKFPKESMQNTLVGTKAAMIGKLH
jgi:hypothetical protein